MTSHELTLILFDIDGTVFDSQTVIVEGIRQAFTVNGFPPPVDCAITRTIGLSLDQALEQMAQKLTLDERAMIAMAYRERVNAAILDVPFYSGMEGLLHRLAALDHVFIGAATGKGRRGLDPLLAHKGLDKVFRIRQTPDHYPSKPHPEMILSAMNEYGFSPSHVVMIGDTCYDIEMAHAARVRSIGVSWGYHDQELIEAEPSVIVEDAESIEKTLRAWNLL